MPALGPINEHSSARMAFTLRTQDGEPIVPADLVAMTLTLYNRNDGAIINGRDQQDVHEQNNVSVDEQGRLVWDMQPEDNVLLSRTSSTETHVALFMWEWPTGHHHHEQMITVRRFTAAIG